MGFEACVSGEEQEKRKGRLTVGEASRHAGRGERVSLLGVDELTHRGQLVDFPVRWGAGAEGGWRLHGGSGAGERRWRAVNSILHIHSGT